MARQRQEGAIDPEDAPTDRGDADFLVRGEGGHVFRMDVPVGPIRQEVFLDQVAKGLIVILDGDDNLPDAEPVAVIPEQPAKNASTEAWQAYALSVGMDAGEVELASRDELVELLYQEPAED